MSVERLALALAAGLVVGLLVGLLPGDRGVVPSEYRPVFVGGVPQLVEGAGR